MANMMASDLGRERKNLEKLSIHSGQFEGFNVTGFRLLDEAGIVNWKLNLWNDHGGADYWMTGPEFREVATHNFDPRASGATTYEVGSVTEPSPLQRAALRAALLAWRKDLAVEGV